MLEVWSQGVGRGILSLTSLMHACLVAQLHPALCNPMDCNLPCSSVWDSPSKNIGVGGEGDLPLQPSGKVSELQKKKKSLSFKKKKVSELLLWWAWVWFLVGELFLMAHGVVQKKNKKLGTSLVVQWLRLWAAMAGGIRSSPGWGTKFLQCSAM